MPDKEITFKGDPRTVWTNPESIDRLLWLAERHCDPSHNNRVVVFAGGEYPIQAAFGMTEEKRNHTLASLRKYFGRIVYQTKDIDVEGVHLAPMGFCWGYILSLIHTLEGHDYPQLFARAARIIFENASRTTLSQKKRWVLATTSKVAAWLDKRTTLLRVLNFLRNKPGDLVMANGASSNVYNMLAAYRSRQRLRRWARQPQTFRIHLHYRSLHPRRWWVELPKYRFVLNPMGSGVMTAKTAEALLVLTVPIITHRGYKLFFELVQMGFPLVLVRDWSEVRPKMLRAWWGRLSPRLESFRRNCLTTDGYWKLMTGEISVCH